MSLNQNNLFLTGQRLLNQGKSELLLIDGLEVGMVHLHIGAIFNCPDLVAYVKEITVGFNEMTEYHIQQVLDAVQAGAVKASPQALEILQKALAWLKSDVVDEETGQHNNAVVLFSTSRAFG